ncbi:MAG: cardiolipin synthase [Eubacteriales bacterium]|nr:cardiolipin synthase [Eubacteriales bacterium]
MHPNMETNANTQQARSLIARIFAAVFNRITLTVIVIVLEVYYLVVFLSRIDNNAAHWVEVATRFLPIVMAVFIVNTKQNPSYKIAWIVLIAVIPELGTLMYLVNGGNRFSWRLRNRIRPVEEAHWHLLRQRADLGLLQDGRMRKTAQYVIHKGHYPAWGNTEAKYYPVGEDMFEDMMEDLRNAKHFIFLEYFIIREGTLWRDIFKILKEKAASGVEIRIIYDDIGSGGKLPKHFVRELKAAGIRVMTFNAIKPVVSLIYNTRDHRKIAVIDGYIGYSGGANISDEYANRVVHFGHWKDCGIRLCGEGVWNFTVMFLNMWNSFEHSSRSYTKYQPHVYYPGGFPSDGIVQPFSDTPLDDENLGENVYMEILNQASKYVYIYTPYLILDNEMEESIELAAKRGVDVRIVTPGIPDKRIVYALSRSYYRSLMKAGVKIFEYAPGFIHSKCFLSDDRIAVVGTINLDYRSLYLHFEDGVLLMENKKAIGQMKEDTKKTFRRSRRVLESDLRRHPIASLIAFVVRLLAPLL